MEEKTYKVTIGIPVYNVEKYIRLTMDSALAQTFESIEFLVLDDCGSDSSIDIIREYQNMHPRGKDIRIVRQPHNGGIGEARNKVVKEAQGRYLYFLDADDTIAPATIELLYGQAQKYDADIVYGSYQRIEEFNGETKKRDYSYPHIHFLKENEFAERVYQDYNFLQASTWNFLIDINVIRNNHLRFMDINYWEDFVFTMDLPIYITRAVLLPEITYYYYCRFGSLSNYQQRDYISKGEIQATIKAMEEIKAQSDLLRDKPYFAKRMNKVMLTCFYVTCAILKNQASINPHFSKREIRDVMSYPLSLCQVLNLRLWVLRNLMFYLLGQLSPVFFVPLVRYVGKRRGLI